MQARLRSIPLFLALGLGLACGGSGTSTPPAPAIAVGFQPHATATDTDPIQLHATISGTNNPALIWSVREAHGGTVQPTADPGVANYWPPDPEAGTFHVRATSVADPSSFAETAITVAHPVQVSLSSGGILTFGSTLAFTATVTRSADTTVTWSSFGPTPGVVNANGLFTAPAVPGFYLVTATSHADPTKSASSSVLVYDPASTVTITPSTVTTTPGGTVTFAVGLSPANPALFVSYWMEENAANALSFTPPGSLVFQAPTTPGVYHVHLRYFEDPSLEAVATVTVN